MGFEKSERLVFAKPKNNHISNTIKEKDNYEKNI